MLPDQVEQTKRDYTDQYVALDTDRPELARFAGLVGQVKTVNMSGRALVEWLEYHQNIGWYDIPVNDLKIVDKPVEPQPDAETKTAKRPATKPAAGLSPLELLRQQGGTQTSKPVPPSQDKPAGLSPLEQLRRQGGTKQASGSEPRASPPADAGKPATADILAKLRAGKGQQAPPSDDQ